MSANFYDYVRGVSDQVPPGYSDNGMRAYRHLVYVGASQMVEAQDLFQLLNSQNYILLQQKQL